MKILIIDDDPTFRDYLVAILENVFSYEVWSAEGYHPAINAKEIDFEAIDLAIIDLNMPIVDGFETGLRIKSQYSHIVTIMLTAFPSINEVIKALRDYQFDDFLIKSDLEDTAEFKQLKGALNRAKKLLATRQALNYQYRLSSTLRSQIAQVHQQYIGNSSSYAQIYELIARVAPSDTTVLITGETGTGKELVAKEIHRLSHRSSSPMVPINCSAIPFAILESELFGHKKGSFTGAVDDREGFFKLAEGGTLFLDEIGEMPLALQTKLLRVLEEKQFYPVGSSRLADIQKMNVRIISATHNTLDEKVERGRFRRDLLYRLNTMTLTIPPLRDRAEDIEPLIDYFIAGKTGSDHKIGVDAAALAALKHWHWPGNVRELQNVIERALLFCQKGQISLSDLPDDLVASSGNSKTAWHSPPSSAVSSNPQDRSLSENLPEKTQAPSEDRDKVWLAFQNNGFKLWHFEDKDSINRDLKEGLKGAQYFIHGRVGKLLTKETFTLKTKLHYLDPVTESVETRVVNFHFLKTTGDDDLPPPDYQGEEHLDECHQIVYKGLPDTYLFNLLYPPAKKSKMSGLATQRVIRAMLLRYIIEHGQSMSLKSVFEQTMSFLIDQQIATLVKGLKTTGLEAMRAYLCGADHIFSGVAGKLKRDPNAIREEIRFVFSKYSKGDR